MSGFATGLQAAIPSPEQGTWYLGPVPVRAYALAIILGIVAAIWLGERRWQARGGRPGAVQDLAVWAVPSGLIGARLYHVVTSPEYFFGDEGSLVQILYVWRGGLGVWGAIAGGALGGYLYCRRAGIRFPAMADALAPGIVVAQAIGRWGNYFNQELFGEPTDLPWGLEIDAANRPSGFRQVETFHPTFLYESLWCLAVAAILVWADRRWQLGHGRVFALYVALYTFGRFWFEGLRIDEAHTVAGLRVNAWVSIAVFAAAVTYVIVVGRRHPGREDSVTRREPDDAQKPEEAEPAESSPHDD